MTSNPFRSHRAGTLSTAHVDQSVTLSGWVHRHRHHGALIFFDLRDGSGLVQVTCDPALSQGAHEVATALRPEHVVRITGQVRRRPDPNPHLATGEIEVLASTIELLNPCATLPFQVDTEGDAPQPGEELRLAYRYLDLRRPEMRELLMVRHQAVRAIRECLNKIDFCEIETPILMKSTPEGARDFLVPSRVNPGTFYALPQSPQLYKQILMVAGMERYYQIAKCFRDEDMRADRQPEFTQLDLEMSFVTQEDVFQVTEACIAAAVQATRGIEIETPLPRLTYAEAMERYGTDKPDIRFGLELASISDLAEKSGFGVFHNAVQAGGVVKALRIPDGASRSRKAIGELEKVAKIYGARGLAWFKLDAEAQATGGIAKFLGADELAQIISRTEAESGDAVVFVADAASTVNAALSNLRNQIGRELHLADRDDLRFVWIVDFPMFEETEEGWAPLHHMFTLPNADDLEQMEDAPGSVHAQLYDLVLNGWELGSGSIRCHDAEIQRRIMSVVGMSEEEADRRFGFLLKALDYGAPPHGGVALGIDRLVTLLAPRECNMRDVIAFPKTLSGVSLMDGCPATVDREQLDELGIAVIPRDPHS
jgi:aspartyl-tRNA synthetase